MVAARLSEDPRRSVLLLEAGPDYPDLDAMPADLRNGNNPWRSAFGPDAHTWGYRARSNPGRPVIELPRGKVVGGSSAINGQVLLRGLPEDFDQWVAAGNDAWSFAHMLPFYRKLENDLDFGGDPLHGASGPIPVRRIPKAEMVPPIRAFLDAAVAGGFPETRDHNHPDTAGGVGPRPINNVDGQRMSTAVTYLHQARGRPNLTIRGDTLVRRLLVEGERAIGVETECRGRALTIAAVEVIVSPGAINLTVWFPITDALVGHGCLHVVPGSHRRGIYTHCPMEKGSNEVQIPDHLFPVERALPLPMRRGDVLFLNKRTCHGSLSNVSDEVRISFDLRYNPTGQRTGRQVFPGFVARSRRNPASELRDPEAWAELWYATRRHMADANVDVSFNRWDPDAAGCA